MGIRELADKLVAMGEELKALASPPFIPAGDLSLAEAGRVISQMDRSGHINMDYRPGNTRPVSWTVWSGSKYFSADCLRDAVNKAIAHHNATESKADTVLEAQDQVDAITEEVF